MVEPKSETDITSIVSHVHSDNRDPHGLNKHLQLDFFNVIGEPDHSAYNLPFLHLLSQQVYDYSKLYIYRFLTILLGLPLMLLWGLAFGIYTFAMIWVAVPIRRLIQSAIAEYGIYIETASDAAIAPLYRAFGQIWSNVRITLFNRSTESPQQCQV